MTTNAVVAQLNADRPAAVRTLGGEVISHDADSGQVTMKFEATDVMCHSGDVVQGGFVTGMLDAAMAHAVFAELKQTILLPTLEIKVSFLDVTRPGTLTATGQVIRMGKSVVFLEGSLADQDGRLLARGSATARLLSADSRRAPF